MKGHRLLVCFAVLAAFALAAPIAAAAEPTAQATPPAVDAFVLDSPFTSAIPMACHICIYQTWECADQSTNGTPCGPDLGKTPPQPIDCKCGNCNGQFICKRNS